MPQKTTGLLRAIGYWALVLLAALVFGFAISVLSLAKCHAVFGQTPEPPPAIVITLNGPQAAVTLPEIDVTLAEVCEILADYNVVHEHGLMSYLRYFGLTIPETKTIYVNADVSHEQLTETVIHEVVHIIYNRKGYDTRGPYEDLVETKAQKVYAELYGPKPPTKENCTGITCVEVTK